MKRLMTLGAVLVVITTGASAQDLYKCKTPDGRTVVSNAPCAAGSNETVIPSAVSSPRVTPSPSTVLSPQPAAEDRAPRPPVTSNPTVDAAFKALRKIMAATEVGINMRDYGQLVVEAKAVVNDVTVNTSTNKDAGMQKELEACMQAYADALTAWNITLKNDLFLIEKGGKTLDEGYWQGLALHEKYQFTPDLFGVAVSKKNALNSIWKVAKEHLTRATELAK